MATKIPTLKSLVINRRRWGRGTNGGYLLSPANKMCCLGFMARACNVPRRMVDQVSMPDGLEFVYKGGGGIIDRDLMPKKVIEKTLRLFINDNGYSNKLANQAAAINDDEDTTDKQKEAAIRKLFKTVGIRVTFTN